MQPPRGGFVAATIVIATLWAHEADAQLSDVEIRAQRERFQLFNLCRPMSVVIDLEGDAQEIQLTDDQVQAALESRLRAASIYAEDDSPALELLHVVVSIHGPTMALALRFMKPVRDAFGQVGIATAWEGMSSGTHGRDARGVINFLTEHLDEFLANYLRVNESACSRRSSFPLPGDLPRQKLAWAILQMEGLVPAAWKDYWEKGLAFEDAAGVLRTMVPFAFFQFQATSAMAPDGLFLAQGLWSGLHPRPDGEPCAVDGPCR